MNIAAIMDELATALASISDLRISAYPVNAVNPPMAVVNFPGPYNYDATMGRGMDRMTFPVYAMISKNDIRTGRDELAQFADGSGTKSFKEVLEAHTYTSCDSVRVMSVEFVTITVGTNDYMAAVFQVDVIGGN